jgi:hypothetical protein
MSISAVNSKSGISGLDSRIMDISNQWDGKKQFNKSDKLEQ